MIILDITHQDLEVVYAHRYRAWRTSTDANILRTSGQLALALENLRAAGYTPEQIARLERGAMQRDVPRQRIDEFLTMDTED